MQRPPGTLIRNGLALASLMWVSPVAHPQPNGQDETAGANPRLWTSTSTTAAGLAEELTSLYESLADEGRIPTRKLKDEKGRQLVTILKDERLYFGGFNDKMRALACRLNSGHCEILPETGDERAYKWTNSPNDWVVVPDLDLEVETSTWLYDRATGEDLERILVDELGVCEVLDEACRQQIRQINSEDTDVLAPSYEGPMWLPIRQVRIWLDLPDGGALEHRLDRNLVPRVELQQPEPARPKDMAPEPKPRMHPRSQPRSHPEHPLRGPSDDAGERDILPMSFEPRLLPQEPSTVEAESADIAPAAEPVPVVDLEAEQEREQLKYRQESILKLISLPPEAELASRHSLDPGRAQPRVLVVDTQLDNKHCGFDPRLVRAFDSAGNPLAIPPGGREDCGTPIPPGDMDHGTHVGGLIAATPDSAANAVLRGVNPKVRLDAFEKPPGEGDLAIRELWLERTEAMLVKALRELPKVINLSLDYSRRGLGRNDPVRAKLAQLKSTSLVVVAAGNEGLEHGTDGCPRYPACFKLPNVLVVGALNLDTEAPAIWTDADGHRSDIGAGVHLAAPGFEVPSLTRGNAIGELSGTSQATPLVAGAASLLYARAHPRHLPPFKARNRLIYTSDLFPHLHELMLGGRLNVDRALDVESATFVLRPGALLKCGDVVRELSAGDTLKGRVVRTASADQSSQSQGFFLLDPQYPYVEFTHRHPDGTRHHPLKRMVYRPERNEYLLLIGPERTGTELTRIQAALNSPRRWVWLDLARPPEPGVSRFCGFEMLYIDDYVAAMPLEDL